jgi:predicted permease
MFIVQVPLTILLLVRFNGTTASVRRQFRALAANPVLWAIVAGVAVSTLGVTVPGVAVRALDPVGSLALPIALVLIGGSLDPDLPAVDFGATGSVVAIKVAAMPALAAAALGLLGVSRVVFVASVVMLAMPTAVSTYVYATELGGDSEFASLNVFATTVIAVVTLVAVTEILA